MSEYPSNSFKSKEAKAKEASEKKVDKVVTGKVTHKKKNELTKIKDVFISEDVDKVKSYILLDVLVPAVKKAVKDIVTNGIEMLLYGESRSRTYGSDSNSRYTPYSRVSDVQYGSGRVSVPPRYSSTLKYNDLLFETYEDAENVIAGMQGMLDKYGVVSIADLFDLVDEPSTYTDNNYGWTALGTVGIVRAGDAFSLKLPRATPIK